jgi:hypothetical protein
MISSGKPSATQMTDVLQSLLLVSIEARLDKHTEGSTLICEKSMPSAASRPRRVGGPNGSAMAMVIRLFVSFISTQSVR